MTGTKRSKRKKRERRERVINKSQSECRVIRRFDYRLLIAPFFFDYAIFKIKTRRRLYTVFESKVKRKKKKKRIARTSIRKRKKEGRWQIKKKRKNTRGKESWNVYNDASYV